MLMLTPSAIDAVRDITTATNAPEDAGLRISSADGTSDGSGLELSITAAPAAEDKVLADSGIRIFLDQQAAEFLDDKVLHAELDASGKTAFAIGPQDQTTIDI